MGLAQAQILIHFQMQFDEQTAILLRRVQIVNRQPHALRRCANRFKEMLASGRARFHVHHHVGRNNFADALLDGIGQRVHLLEARGARHADGRIHEMTVARAPDSHPRHVQHAIHAFERPSDFPW